MNPSESLDHYRNRQGWDDHSVIQLLLEYIDKLPGHESFEDFLADRADEEDQATEQEFGAIISVLPDDGREQISPTVLEDALENSTALEALSEAVRGSVSIRLADQGLAAQPRDAGGQDTSHAP